MNKQYVYRPRAESPLILRRGWKQQYPYKPKNQANKISFSTSRSKNQSLTGQFTT